MKIETFVLGPIENNTYLLTDLGNSVCALVDPAAPGREILKRIIDSHLDLTHILITHAHFDHVGGVSWFRRNLNTQPKVVLHRDDLALWRQGGGASDFGFEFDSGSEPEMLIETEQTISIGKMELEILHTPGHTPGHVTFYSSELSSAFCGDLIFYHGVGRTDLQGSSEKNLFKSIKNKIFKLPQNTVLYPGHGPQTTVQEEMNNNPFI